MAQPAVEVRLQRVFGYAQTAMNRSHEYSSKGRWTPEEEQALRDSIDALILLIGDAQAALELAQQDLTNCLNQ